MQTKSEKNIKISSDNWIILLIILFWNFDNSKYDLYDVIYNSLLKIAGL